MQLYMDGIILKYVESINTLRQDRIYQLFEKKNILDLLEGIEVIKDDSLLSFLVVYFDFDVNHIEEDISKVLRKKKMNINEKLLSEINEETAKLKADMSLPQMLTEFINKYQMFLYLGKIVKNNYIIIKDDKDKMLFKAKQ